MTYSGFYLRRTSADSALATCQRRGWEPSLRRVFGLWIVQVAIEAPRPALTAAARQPVSVAGRHAA
jgi:hypothetical protein